MQKHAKDHILSFVLLQDATMGFVMISVPGYKGTFERAFGEILFNVLSWERLQFCRRDLL